MISLTQFSRVDIFQIGCGGTGSWLVPLVSKLANNIKLRSPEKFINYTIIDNDIVEDKNILRQNFSSWDIGKNKAHSLLNRYIFEFEDLKISTNQIRKIQNNPIIESVFEFSQTGINSPMLLIILGCGDNNNLRQLLFKLSKKVAKKNPKISIIYIDSGNLLHNGQIVTKVFNHIEDNQQDLFKKEKKRKINFLKMFQIEVGDDNISQQSCAFFGDQSQAINTMAATLMFINLQKILISSELPPELVTFNSSGYSTFEL